MNILSRARRWFRGEVKEDFTGGGFGYGLVPDPGLSNQNWFRQWVGIYQLVDRMARARGGNLVEIPLDDRMVYIARGLMRYNPYAQGMINVLRTHTLGPKGLAIKTAGPQHLVVQRYLDRFFQKVGWWQWERELYQRVHVEGNAIVRFFPQDDYVDLRPIEPEWIIAKDGTVEWTFGFYNEPGDVQNVTALHVLYGDQDEVIDGNEWYHIKSKITVRAEKRGISDFLASASLFDDSFKTWRNFAQSEAVRQSITYFREHPEGVSAPDLEQAIAAQADYKPPQSLTRSAGDPIKLKYGSGIEDLPPGTKLSGTPAAASIQSTMTGINATMLAAGRQYSIPLVLMTGDMSANNTLDFTDESPFMMAIEDEQYWYTKHIEALLWRVVEIGVEERMLQADVLYDGTKVMAVAKRPLSSNMMDNTTRAKTLYDDGFISGHERAVLEGVDYDAQEAERRREGVKTAAEIAQQAASGDDGDDKQTGGYTKKKIPVHRQGKTYYETRKVKVGDK